MQKTKIFLIAFILLILGKILIGGISSFFSSTPLESKTSLALTLYDINFDKEERLINVLSHTLEKHDEKGNTTTLPLKEHQGKVIIIHFWGVDCPPCKKELPHYNTFVTHYPQIIHIPLTLSMEETVDTKKMRADLDKFSGKNLPLITDKNLTLARLLKIEGLPTTVFINKKGNVVGKVIGPVDWQDPKVITLILKTIEASEQS